MKARMLSEWAQELRSKGWPKEIEPLFASVEEWLNREGDEYYCNCGTALSRHERFLCYDCQQDEWYDEDQAFYEGWYYNDE